MKLEITKMHGIGNSYVILEDLGKKFQSKYSKIAKMVSDKNFGVGSDGILVVNKGRIANYWMRVFNPDGSEAEKSGNGIRMFARYLYDKRLIEREAEIEVGGSKGGTIVRSRINNDNSVTVDMGKGELLGKKTLEINGMKFVGMHVSVGNPHFVVFANSEREAKDNALKYGSAIENHGMFKPNRTNVEFVFVKGKDNIALNVWERGAGLTLSSGTGSCASAFAAFKENKVKNKVNIELPGGNLKIEVKADDRILMSGPAEYIFSGSIDLDKIVK